jgi:seryl-tRNA synthetase
MDFTQLVQILNIVVPLVGGLAGVIAAIATYRNIINNARHEEERLDLEAQKLKSQKKFDEVSLMERIQQMSMQVAEKQANQNRAMRDEINVLKSEINAINDANSKLKTRLHDFIVDIEDVIYDFRKLPCTKENNDLLIKKICEIVEKSRNQNGFH